MPMLGVFLLLVFPLRNSVTNSKVLLPLRWLGDRSYSAYLWHWPVWLVFNKLVVSETLSIALAFLVTITLSTLSYRFIELPFMNRGPVTNQRSSNDRIFGRKLATKKRELSARWTRAVVGLSSVLLIFFASIGFEGHLLNPAYRTTWLAAQKPEIQKAYELVRQQSLSEFHSFADDATGPQDFAQCHFLAKKIDDEVAEQLHRCREKHGPGTMIIGDSHAVDLFGTLSSRFSASFMVGITRKGCRPNDGEACPYEEIMTYFEENRDVFQLVIYEQAGFYLLKEGDGTPGTRDMFDDLGLNDSVENLEIDAEQVEATSDYLSQLSSYVPVKWFLPRAEPHISDTQIVEQGCNFHFRYRPGQKEVFEELDKSLQNHVESLGNANFITDSQIDFFGFDLPADFMNCNEIYWKDGDHLSAAGEKRFGLRLHSNFLMWQVPKKLD
jgi:hypothetical protein